MTDFDLNFDFELTALPANAEIIIAIDNVIVDKEVIETSASGSYSFNLDYFSQIPANFSISFANLGAETLTVSNFSINSSDLEANDFTFAQGAISNPNGSFSLNNSSNITWSGSNAALSAPPASSNGLYAHIGNDRLDINKDGNFATNPNLGPNLNGTDGDDDIFGDESANMLNGFAGNDFIRGFDGDDNLIGGDGNDKIYGNEGDDTLSGEGDDDLLNGGSGNDTLYGGLGVDRLYGDDGNDILYGNDGDDLLRGNSGNDTLYGAAGNDDLRGDEGDDQIFGGEGNDFLTATSGTNTIDGGNGNDIIRGGTEIDTVIGGDGDDDIRTGDGNDIITLGNGNDFTDAGDGDDIIFSGLGINNINGGNGIDTVDYSAATQGLQINIDRGTDFSGDGKIDEKLINVENAYATNFDDMIFSYDGHNGTFYGLDGNDIFRGRSGIDTVFGGNGNDDIRTEGGDDIIDGGAGNDFVLSGDGVDTITGGSGNDQLRAGNGNDIVFGGLDNDRLYGEDGNDELHGGDGSDLINGGLGNDQIYGDDGDDRLVGKEGNDIIYGGDGNDLIRGLEGVDTLYGGDGDDTFIYTLNDTMDSFYGGAGNADTIIISGNDTTDLDFNTMNVDGIEIVSLANYKGGEVANNFTFNAGDIVNISDSGSFTVIGDNFDSVNVFQLGVGDFQGVVSQNGYTLDHYNRNGTDFYFTQNISLTLNESAIANDDLFTINEDTVLNFTLSGLLANDVDLPGATTPFQVISIGSASNGSVVVTGDNVVYDSDSNFYGTETITYTIQDQLGNIDTGDIIITINNINDAPVARDDNFTGQSGTTISGNLFSNNGNGIDFDIDGDTLILNQTGSLTTDRGNIIQVNADGSFDLTVAENFFGTDLFSYTINDGNGRSDTATVTFEISNNSTDVDFIFLISQPSTIPSDNLINSSGPYAEKSIGVSFTTSADVVTRQVIYEQGGGTRGMSIYIENGELVYAAWNLAEENWGYKEVTTAIQADTSYTATSVLDGALPANGTLTGFLDGAQVGQVNGVGLLYNHNPAVVGRSDGTNYGSGNNNSANIFQGSIQKIGSANSVVEITDLPAWEEALSGQFIEPVMAIEDPSITTTFDDPKVNDSGPYAEKTLAARFTTGSDITTRQVVYEQGGTVRGMNIFIENGEAFIAAWNFAEENWGYKEFSANITANSTFTIAMVLDGVLPENGTLTGYFNGSQIGQFSDVGYLYSHSGDIGFARMDNDTVIHGTGINGNGLDFLGDLDIIVEYNSALDQSLLPQLDAYLAGITNNPVIDTSIVGGSTTINGTVGNDTIDASNDDEIIFGGDGDDIINSLGGNDAVHGGTGNDTINAGQGNDTLYGNDGDDFLRSDTGANQFFGDDGNDTIRGGLNNDTAHGGNGNDDIRTNDGDDTVYGGAGLDYVDAGAGNDRIEGGSENDIIRGGLGDDTMIGGAGVDKLYGDGGNNIFGFSFDEDSIDSFYGFDLIQDQINITDLLTGFSGTDITDFARLIHTGSRFDLQVDRDGTGNSHNFQTVAKILTNIADTTTAQDLFDSGILIADQTLL